MENFAALFVPALLLVLLLRLISLPVKLGWKLLLNSICGFACLWLLNSIAGFTGIRFPINWVTAFTAGFLGLPGIGLLALLQTAL